MKPGKRRVRVDAFWIDAGPVTNRQFAQFVAETGYRTTAGIPADPRDYPGMDPAMPSRVRWSNAAVLPATSGFAATPVREEALLRSTALRPA